MMRGSERVGMKDLVWNLRLPPCIIMPATFRNDLSMHLHLWVHDNCRLSHLPSFDWGRRASQRAATADCQLLDCRNRSG